MRHVISLATSVVGSGTLVFSKGLTGVIFRGLEIWSWNVV